RLWLGLGKSAAPALELNSRAVEYRVHVVGANAMAAVSAQRDSTGSSQPARRKWSFPWARTVNPMRHESPVSRLISYHLDARPEMRIADIGAGAGYWTFRL